MSNTLQPQGLQHARLFCPLLPLRVCSNSCPSSWWCYLIISSSDTCFSFCFIRVFSNDSPLHIRWPKYWSFSFSISPSSEYSWLICFRIDWFDILAVQRALKSLLQHHSLKTSILQSSAFFMVQLSHPCMTTGKTMAFEYMDLCQQIYYLVPIFSHSARKATWQVRFPRAKSLDTNVNSDKNLDIFKCCFPQPLQHALIQINGCQSLWERTAMHSCHDDMRFFLLGTQPLLSHWVLDLKTGPEIMPFYWNSYPQSPGCPSVPLMGAHLSCPCDAMFYQPS